MEEVKETVYNRLGVEKTSHNELIREVTSQVEVFLIVLKLPRGGFKVAVDISFLDF